jgi:hypothetical protein
MKSYQHQRVPSSVGTSKQCHTRWRDHSFARWLSVLSLFICTVGRFSSPQWQTVRRVFGNLTLVGDRG